MRLKPEKPDPEVLALQALAFLAADDERLTQFLTLTGLDLGQMRQMAQKPAALGAILDYLLNWEPLLLEFAAEVQVSPELIVAARRMLPGASPD